MKPSRQQPPLKSVGPLLTPGRIGNINSSMALPQLGSPEKRNTRKFCDQEENPIPRRRKRFASSTSSSTNDFLEIKPRFRSRGCPKHLPSLNKDLNNSFESEKQNSSVRDSIVRSLFKESSVDLTVHKDLLINPFKSLNRTLPHVPRPTMPDISDPHMSMFTRLVRIQKYIQEFEYNYIEQHFFDITRLRSLKNIISTAKEIMNDCLPIRCVEGTFLAINCTQEFDDVDRFGIFFETSMANRVYRHIVCLMRFKGRFGVLGLSRKSDLFYKPLNYFSASEIIREYILSYSKYGHKVQLINISLPISHDSQCKDVPMWNFLTLDLIKQSLDDSMRKVDRYMNEVTLGNSQQLAERKLTRKKKPSPNIDTNCSD